MEGVIFGVAELLAVSQGLLPVVFILNIVLREDGFVVWVLLLFSRVGWVFYTSHESESHSMNPLSS